MKKTIAALLLTIYLFNIGGQLALHRYLDYLSNRFFNEQTSKGLYNVGDLTEVILPVNMSGITDWTSYENISGQINFENVSYNYVKMKITRTALYLMCVPDYNTTELTGKNIIDAREAKSAHIPKKEHVPYSKTVISSQFSYAFTQFTFSSFVKTLPGPIIHSSGRSVSQYGDIPKQPPKFFS